MRMRRKKHLSERLDACSPVLIDDIFKYNGNLKSVFSDEKPLHLEIGCGKGGFVSGMAKKHPNINFIAIEKNLNVLVLASEKIKNEGIKNVKFLAGDATILEGFQTETKADVLYINFCDPWAKKRYAKRRLTHATKLTLWKTLLKENGEIHFKTDNKDLFEFSLNSFSDFGMKLKNISLDLHKSDFTENVMTEYETMFSEMGMPIYRCEAIFK